MESSPSKPSKLLLLGRSGAGKTSIHSIIFANYHAYETESIGYTQDKLEKKIKFMGDLALSLWDCGGQEKLLEKWFTQQKDEIFSAVGLLIYVIDINNKNEKYESDLLNYSKSVQILRELSPKAKVFVLLHKIDMVPIRDRDTIFQQKKAKIEELTQGNAAPSAQTIVRVHAHLSLHPPASSKRAPSTR